MLVDLSQYAAHQKKQQSLIQGSDSMQGTKQSNKDDEEESVWSNSDEMADRKAEKDATPGISEQATKTVWSIRAMFLIILVLTTLGVSLTVYFYVTRSEKSEFEAQFYEESSKVLQAIGSSLDLTLGLTDSLSVALVSYASHSNSSWPYVTLPDFAIRAAKIRNMAKAMSVEFYPLVQTEQRESWEHFTASNNAWVDEAIALQENDDTFKGLFTPDWQGSDQIFGYYGPLETPGPYLPGWTICPVVYTYFSPYNWDLLHEESPISREAALDVIRTNHAVITKTDNLPDPNDPADVEAKRQTTIWASGFIGDEEDASEPLTFFYYPIQEQATNSVESYPQNGTLVGVVAITIYWRELIKDILPRGSNGIIVVISNACNQMFTYQINGPNTLYVGRGDVHESRYDEYRRHSKLSDLEAFASGQTVYTGAPLSTEYCPYEVEIYPSSTMEDRFKSSNAAIFTATAVGIFLFTSLFFLFYDYFVQRRQREVLKTAVQSTAIVSSLFPENVRERLVNEQMQELVSPKARLQSVLDGGNGKDSSSPIADLFAECTVMFADISGFTAWCSVREPGQVFHLLETVYGAFDDIAAHRGVFKVETIGDSYLAVCGLPQPRKDHAVVMVRFAYACREKMHELTSALGHVLGPDTGDLRMRFGLYSGPVTAGVIRGKRSRFQLFGDTVNTAARMESTGKPNLIHIGETTAELLKMAGKQHWVTVREGMIEAKGKGKMQTYWCDPKGLEATPSMATPNGNSPQIEEKILRLIDWNKEVLCRLLRQILAHRAAIATEKRESENLTPYQKASTSGTVLDEVVEVIQLPKIKLNSSRFADVSLTTTEIPENVVNQLHELVAGIAQMYQEHPFHGFEHASHVAMSVSKLLSRIVAPDITFSNKDVASTLHDYTYGITSDPLTQFACAFAALIHDVDHPGVPNMQLVKERAHIAAVYNNKSVAEQNSVDISWALLQDERFKELRDTICATEAERLRFRQIVVNAVMATDIMDKDLKALRDQRWDKAFQEEGQARNESSQTNVNRKATIVIEHMIQASDVAHTMQHWHIYLKWNRLLFKEMLLAYKNGRAIKDPSSFWYEGEIGFFDNYIIPLAGKLCECGVFGVSSHEYLNYAMKNRQEWKEKGQQIVAEMIEEVKL